MCVDTCVEHQSVTSGGGEYIFPQPRVAKCTGLGGGVYFESCSDGYFDAITQTLEGLGVSGDGGGLKEAERKRREEEDMRVREAEEVERVRRLEVERVREEEERRREGGVEGREHKKIEYTDEAGTTHIIKVVEGGVDDSIERFCVGLGEGREECMQEVAVFFAMFHPEFLN